jgi:hypothetical protein
MQWNNNKFNTFEMNDSTHVQMLIVEEMSKKSLTIVVQGVIKVKYYLYFHINNLKLF